MGVGQGHGDFIDHVQRLVGTHTLLQTLFQITAGQIFHGKIMMIPGPPHIKHRHDIAMIEAGDDARLTKKTLTENVVAREVSRHDFQRDLTIKTVLHGHINCRHATLSDFFDYFIARYNHIHCCTPPLARCPGLTIGRKRTLFWNRF